jgi:hypothetical protein
MNANNRKIRRNVQTGSSGGQISGGGGGNGVAFAIAVGLSPVLAIADFGIRTNRFGFDITGASGSVVVVQATPSLNDPIWIPLSTNTQLRRFPQQSPANVRRFYPAQLSP